MFGIFLLVLTAADTQWHPLALILETMLDAAAIVNFVEMLWLDEQLVEMERAAAADDFERLAQLAHWLKGSGGTAGFDAFTEPSRQLENLARQGQTSDIPAALAQLKALADRIVIALPETAAR